MLYILIRICVRDDYIGSLAYYSLKKIYPDANYIFLAEYPKQVIIKETHKPKLKFLPMKKNTITEKKDYTYMYQTGVKVSFRPFCDNFGGQMGIKNIIQSIQDLDLNISNDDFVFLVDSDIVAFGPVLNEIYNYDHCGCMTRLEELIHMSGQFQIMSGQFYKLLIGLTNKDIEHYLLDMTAKKIPHADDTFISYISDIFKLKKKHICNWVHHKFYSYSGDLRFDVIIEEIKTQYMINAVCME